MKILLFNGEEHKAVRIIRGTDYIIGYNSDNLELFSFLNVINFSVFALKDNAEWDLPDPKPYIPKVVDDLTTGGHNDVLSAEQGKIIKDYYDAQSTRIDSLSASDIKFSPTSDIQATDAQQAIEQVFLVSSEIIKSVADSLGDPFLATDGNTELKNKLAIMKQHFVNALLDKNIDVTNIDTIHHLIDKVKNIQTDYLKHTDYVDIVAPDVISVNLSKEADIENTTATLFEYVIGEIDRTLYYCEFIPSDVNSFMLNNDVEFVDKLRLKRDFIKSMMAEGTETISGRERNKYSFTPLANGVQSLGDFKIQDFKVLGVDWFGTSMTSDTTPAPLSVSVSGRIDSAYAGWCIFNGEMDSRCWAPPVNRVTNEWVEINFGTVKQFDHIMLTNRDLSNVNCMVKDFEVQVYNNDTSTWDILGTFSTTPWARAETRIFKFDYVGFGNKYRIFVKNNHGDSYIHIGKAMFGMTRFE